MPVMEEIGEEYVKFMYLKNCEVKHLAYWISLQLWPEYLFPN